MRYLHELPLDTGIKDLQTLNGCPVKLCGHNRVNILALGDVGTTMLIGLKLLGGDVISDIGIMDIRRENLERLEIEINQIGYPFDAACGSPNSRGKLPEVHILDEDSIFDCDVLVFCASKGVPPVTGDRSSMPADVRMAQLEANREIISHYASLAHQAYFRGLVAVVSDPVDNLAAAFLDAAELKPWQVQGYGLGVMNKRAEYYARKIASGACYTGDEGIENNTVMREMSALYIAEGRAFGPHGQDLVIANSIEHYDEAVSLKLTSFFNF